MKTEPGHFDPYEILQLSSRSSNASVIKSQYRRLSLKYHPDKNPGNRKVAAAQFNRVAKAYKVRLKGRISYWSVGSAMEPTALQQKCTYDFPS